MQDAYGILGCYEEGMKAKKKKNYLEAARCFRMCYYYYEYGGEALIYTIQKERFNGLFTLEGKYYAKDENDGMNYTNLIYMPKVRVVSDINLRLGERADPTVSTFNIIGLPETQAGDRKGLIMEITHLDSDIDEEL